MFQSPVSSPASYDLALINCPHPVLKVLGLGGGGCNAIERMMELDLRGIEFIAANTDAQALKIIPPKKEYCFAHRQRAWFGSGGDPTKAETRVKKAARIALLSGADMVFLTAGMGGGTGTGSIQSQPRLPLPGAVTIGIDHTLRLRDGTAPEECQ
jgi:cell division protein FtsZ